MDKYNPFFLTSKRKHTIFIKNTYLSFSAQQKIYFCKSLKSEKVSGRSSASRWKVRKFPEDLPQAVEKWESFRKVFRKPLKSEKVSGRSFASRWKVRKFPEDLLQAVEKWESFRKIFCKLSHFSAAYFISFSIYFLGLTTITIGLSSTSIVSTSSFSFPLSFPWALASTKRCG